MLPPWDQHLYMNACYVFILWNAADVYIMDYALSA